MERLDFSCSIVVFNTDRGVLANAISSVLTSTLKCKLYLVDNSPTDSLHDIISDVRVKYIHNPANPGYGTAHNIAIKQSLSEGVKYHLVLNPDIAFQKGTLEAIYYYMETHKDVGQLMPKVFYQDGTIQRLCKLLPDPLDLFGRRFFKNSSWAKRRNERYELHYFNYDMVLNTPCLSGCFMFLRTSVLKEVGLFDERFFMYLEDFDLTRRIHRIARTVFYPAVSIVHGYQNESYRSQRLFRIHVLSTIRYFNKWGWFWDNERIRWNKEVVEEINSREAAAKAL